MAIFMVFVLVWAVTGVIGVFNCKDDGVNWFMLFFMGFAPVLALVAEFCGLL